MKNKVITTIISLILILTIASQFIALLPIANAESAPTKKTFAFIGATPNPVGIGQETLIHLGITHQTARADIGWEDLTVTVIKPDNTTETLGPFKTDSTGGTGTVYVPTMVGTYYFQTHFPEQTNQLAVTLAGILTPAGTIMQASSSEELPLIVQEDPLFHYPGVPLPNEYWTRPIDAQFWGWNSIAGTG